MKNARRLLRKLDYLPRWAWYMLSLFIGGPIGPFVVYLVFHVLTKAADDEEAEQDSVDWGASYDRSGRTYADADCTVTDDAEIEDAWQKTESSASRARREAQPAENTQTDSADDEVSEVIREGRAAMPVEQLGSLSVNELRREVLVDGAPVDLTPKEYELLIYFKNNRAIALSRESILNAVWGYDYFGDLRTVDTHVKKLRAKLGGCGTMIETVRGYGYRFEG